SQGRRLSQEATEFQIDSLTIPCKLSGYNFKAMCSKEEINIIDDMIMYPFKLMRTYLDFKNISPKFSEEEYEKRTNRISNRVDEIIDQANSSKEQLSKMFQKSFAFDV